MKVKCGVIPFTLIAALTLTACSAHEPTREGAPGRAHSAARQSTTVHKSVTHPVVTESQIENFAAKAPVLDMTKMQKLDSIINRLSESRVVYVGETHDSYGHHLNQLEVIRQLHRRNPDMAIGVEFFQQPFQSALDEYISGRSGEKEMLLATEWFERWRFDYRLYRPIMRYAREHGIPVTALNVARELTERVSEVGIEGLSAAERAQIPRQLDDSDEDYRARIRAVYQSHPRSGSGGFDRFLQVQLTWDEGMAERVTQYLQKHTGRTMVVLAGSGHLMYGTGIPDRVSRRLPIASRILLPADSIRLGPDIADFVVYPASVELPQAGLMGVLLEKGEKGVRISGVVPHSAADRAGIKKGDVIQHLNGESVTSVADIKVGMLDKSPGDKVELQILRKQMVWGEEVLQLEFELGGG